MDKQKKAFIINVLRRGTYKWYGRWTAEKRSHLRDLKRYFCEECGEICRKKDTQMDHVLPVIPVEGTEDLNVIADRMYPPPEGWRRLCKPCHKLKTDAENVHRRGNKPKKKKSRKKT